MGRSAMGVKAIELDDDDQVVGFAITDPDRQHVLAVCERGYGKRTELEEFRQQRRGGKGIILIDTSERNGPVVGLALVNEKDEVMLVTNRGQTIRTRVDEIRLTGRNAQGVRVMNVDADERVVAIEPVGERDEEDVVSTSGEKPESTSTDDAEPTTDGDTLDPSDADTASTSNGAVHDDEPVDDVSDSEGSDDDGSDEDET
jgi:DNA gyrase subunit A